MPGLNLNHKQRKLLKRRLKTAATALQLRRAQALWWVDQGVSKAEVARRLGVSRQSVVTWCTRAVTDRGWIARGLVDDPRPGRPPTQRQVLDAVVPGWLAEDPRAQGVPRSGWTNRALRQQVERRLGMRVSHQTMRAAIRRAGYAWKRPRYTLSRRPEHWRQAKGGLKRGLQERERTVVLMADEVILTETPPLGYTYARLGEQAQVPITGNRSKRIVYGVLNVHSGHLELWICPQWDALWWQAFLVHLRQVWRGWHLVLFLDRGSPHTADESIWLAEDLGIELRWLPVATPELNAVEGLWRAAKGEVLANWPARRIAQAALAFCRSLLELTPRQRLQKAGVLRGRFWLTTTAADRNAAARSRRATGTDRHQPAQAA